MKHRQAIKILRVLSSVSFIEAVNLTDLLGGLERGQFWDDLKCFERYAARMEKNGKVYKQSTIIRAQRRYERAHKRK